ncbi:GNAT family N-acetyltransferase [Altererythrobacter indicus]|uniref:GNAT family N-acetyltransferase n=1 Tax=Altericroceibacterium indicum TaxID=374177 RepID=A0A845A6I5_9SPHN|nr:N-acetyltransferase [Altericroceibacterium indicum]MXP25982.1 GNAT family N-acetyltransferase [Altericroceibacterium indicum]
MELRGAKTADAPALAALGQKSFCAAFAHLYDPSDLNTFLKSAYDLAGVEREIADPLFQHRLAFDDGRLVGFTKVKLTSSYGAYSDASRPIFLSQLYTDPAMTGQGIGARLIDWVFATAKSVEADAIQLSVWSENFGAQKFYRRYGFNKIADIDFWVGNHRDDEFLMEVKI